MSLRTAELAAVLAVFLFGTAAAAKKSRGLWTGLLLFAVLCGFLRGERCSLRAEQERALFSGGERTVEGILKSLEESENGYSGVLVGCRTEGGKAGGAALFFEEDPQLREGDRIRVSGRCSLYEPSSNPGEFDYRSYYGSLGIRGKINGEEWEILPGGSALRRTLEQLKKRLAEVLEECAGEYSGIFQAMLLGDKGGIPDRVYELYQKNGISHLLAISGLHVSMLGMGFYGLVRKAGAGKRTAALGGICLMTCYGLLTGFSPSTQRAVIMYGASVLAGCAGRTYDLPTALGTAAAVILWREPEALTQGGVQLSFLAVGGIGILGRKLEQAQLCKGKAGRTVLAGLAVQLATYPAVAYHYFVYPPYGIFLNLLVIPLMAYAMASGLLCLALGMISPAAGRMCAGSGIRILQFYEELCIIFSRLPGSSLVTGRPALWQLALYGALLGGFFLGMERLGRKRTALAAVTAALFLIVLPLPEKGLKITYLDVGQGDGIVLQTEGRTFLIDGGSTDRRKLGGRVLEPFLLSEGKNRVDAVFVSHCDSDHVSGLKELMEEGNIRIGRLLVPAGSGADEAERELLRLAEKRGIPAAEMGEGDSLSLGGLKVTCLSPGKNDPSSEDRNERSMVLLAEYGGGKFLFTGDIGAEKERELLADSRIRERIGNTAVLKVAHHGSAASTCGEFLETVRPVWAVISYGRGNAYGHPSPEVLDRLRQGGTAVLETGKNGAVSVKTDGRRLWIRPFLK